MGLRGKEKALFKTKGAIIAVSQVLKGISEAHKTVIRKAFAKLAPTPFEIAAWDKHKIFFIGGGSQIEAMIHELRQSPLMGNEGRMHDTVFQERPSDLYMADGSRVLKEVLPHVAVAYGLSNFAADVPHVESPNEVPPMKQTDSRLRPFRTLLEKDEWRYN